MCLGEGVKPVFSYLFFFTCMRGAGRDLMGGFFCPIGVQRCIVSRFSTTSQARLISYQILLLNYSPPSQAGTRPGSPGKASPQLVLPPDVSSPQVGTRPGSLYRFRPHLTMRVYSLLQSVYYHHTP